MRIMGKNIVLNRANLYDVFLSWLCAIIGFLSIRPYFVWNTYLNGALDIFRIIILGGTFLILLFNLIVTSGKLKINKLIIGLALLLVYLYQRSVQGVFNFAIGSIITIGIIFLFINLKEIQKKDVYLKFKTIFALSLISGVVVWFITTIGFDIPYSRLMTEHVGKSSLGIYYKNYFGSIFMDSVYDIFLLKRMCGMFDEPGVIGTYSALILIVENFKIKGKWQNTLILIAGILSFSLAFWIMSVTFYILRSFKKGTINIIISIIVMVLAYLIFLNINTENLYILGLQQRLAFSNGFFMGDNRTESSFDVAYNLFLEGKDGSRIFGNGLNAAANNLNMFGSYSYKMLIYDYGFLGFAMIIIWLIFSVTLLYKRNWECIILLLIFLLSIYQRPYIIEISYMIVLFGGCSYLNNKSINNKVFKIKTNLN